MDDGSGNLHKRPTSSVSPIRRQRRIYGELVSTGGIVHGSGDIAGQTRGTFPDKNILRQTVAIDGYPPSLLLAKSIFLSSQRLWFARCKVRHRNGGAGSC